MEIDLCTKADYDQILREIVDFWGSERTLAIHYPSLLYEFGNAAFVMRQQTVVVGYLFGFIAQTAAVGYIHLVGVRQRQQGQGIGRRLHEHFVDFARSQGCHAVKAITTPSNRVSIAFHQRLGMTLQGEPNEEGIPVVRDYSGPGQDRVVFWKAI